MRADTGADTASGAVPAGLHRGVFLDRDGTLIRNDGDLGDPDLVELLPGVAEGVRQLLGGGYRLVVVTNQGGVARGAYDEAAVDATHARLEQVLRSATGLPLVITDFLHCPFHPQGTVERYRREHPWRKPQPGMLLEAARRHALHLPASWMVGDQERDAAAGAAAGCRSVLLGTPSAASAADYFARTLPEAATRIMHEDAPRVLAGTVTLHAMHTDTLADPQVRQAIAVAAESLAERSGVRLLQLEWDQDRVTATLEGGELVALGFAAELRRLTHRWWRARGELAPLWAGA
ncbi:MAG: D-glycero-beta-D-manno-heptose,7-bisphosphate 7-phosphatase [Planctomycetota bacterium]